MLKNQQIVKSQIARKSIVAKLDIKKGEILTEEKITIKRPGNGINPMRWDEIVGTIANKDYTEDELICIVTGTRAEYGLLYWLMKEIELQIIVTGMHLSSEFGLTYKEFKIDTSIGISKSMGLAQISFAEAYEDIVIVLGDRYEIFSATSAAMIAKIPIAHLHGGETTEGAFDES